MQMPCAFRSTVVVVLGVVVVPVRYGRAIITTNNAGWLAGSKGGGSQGRGLANRAVGRGPT